MMKRKTEIFYYRLSEIKLTLNIPKVYKEIKKVLLEESLWNEYNRKPYNKRLVENIIWYFKYKEPCIYYNSYGFDVEGLRETKDYLPYRQFRIERFLEDCPDSLYNNKICVLRDKVLFASYFGNVLGEKYVVPTVGLLKEDGLIYDFINKEKKSYDHFFSQMNMPLFIKKVNGECGEGCYVFKNYHDAQRIENVILGSTYIIQKQLQQHNEVNSINSSCINTVRIITIIGKKDKTPKVFAHYMRVGCNSINDNRATGGVGVAITEEGKLSKFGVGHHRIETKHSVSGTVYEGKQIPFWHEVYELVIKAHEALPEIPTIGWDVALTPNGPVLIEGNDNWEISGAQDSYGGLKRKWYELHR